MVPALRGDSSRSRRGRNCSRRPRRSSTRRAARRGSPSRRSSFIGAVLDAARVDVDPARQPPAATPSRPARGTTSTCGAGPPWPCGGGCRAGRRGGRRCAPTTRSRSAAPRAARAARNSIWPASRWPSSVARRNERGVRSITRTGPSHGAAMRTTYSSPTHIPSSGPSTFWKRANSVGATRLRSPATCADELLGRTSAARGRARGSGGGTAGPRRRRRTGPPRGSTPSGAGRRVVGTAPASSRRCIGVVRHM